VVRDLAFAFFVGGVNEQRVVLVNRFIFALAIRLAAR
jgi:hypothetical protein